MANFYGTSTYTLETIDKRLAFLNERGELADPADEAERQRELRYLTDLRMRKFPESPNAVRDPDKKE